MNILTTVLVISLPLISAANSSLSDQNNNKTNNIVYISIFEFEPDTFEPGFPMVPDADIQPTNFSIYPFVAAVLTENHQYVCSAALVSYRMFLTAAPCVSKRPFYISLPTNTGISSNDSLTVRITKMIQYRSEAYVQDRPVAMLFTTPYGYIPGITKISLAYDLSWKGSDCTAIGFGLDKNDHKTRVMQEVLLHNVKDTLDKSSCFNDLGAPVISGDTLIGVVTKATDRCIDNVTKEVDVTLSDDIYEWVEKLILDEVVVSNLMSVAENLRTVREDEDYRDSHATNINDGRIFIFITSVSFAILIRNL